MSRETIFGNYSQVILPFCVGIVNPPGLDIYGKNEFLYLPTKTLCGLETSQITIFSGRGCYRREFCASKIARAYIWKGFAFEDAAPEGLWVQGGGGGGLNFLANTISMLPKKILTQYNERNRTRTMIASWGVSLISAHGLIFRGGGGLLPEGFLLMIFGCLYSGGQCLFSGGGRGVYYRNFTV